MPPTPRQWKWPVQTRAKAPPLLIFSILTTVTVPMLSMAAYSQFSGRLMSGRVLLIVFAATMAVNISVALFLLVRGLRLWKPLIEHSCRLCLRCHYPLPENVERGRCPECGLDYELADTVAAWRKGGTATWRR